MKIRMNVNGHDHEIEAPPLRRLVDILREDFGLVAAKIGCGEGECGSCNVIVDGKVVSSCLIPAIHTDGSRIVTLEGLGEAGLPPLDSLRESFLRHDASQCGACIPGLVMTCLGSLGSGEIGNRRLTEPEIRGLLGGNLCRCTGYEGIVRAVMEWLETEAAQ